jgi:hypothetical protein
MSTKPDTSLLDGWGPPVSLELLELELDLDLDLDLELEPLVLNTFEIYPPMALGSPTAHAMGRGATTTTTKGERMSQSELLRTLTELLEAEPSRSDGKPPQAQGADSMTTLAGLGTTDRANPPSARP